MTFTWGTHNLHDQAGTPTMFADAVIFTEAIPNRIRHTALRATGHAVIVCHQQPDLVMVLRRKLFKVTGRSYTKYVDGVPKVTPNRGTFIVFANHRPTGTPIAFVGEHRINAAFRPWIRGEREFRERAWAKHYQGTAETIIRLARGGFIVCAGGDVNTPEGQPGYPIGMHERGEHFDRLAANRPLGFAEYLSRKGSDHPRLRAEVRL